MAGSSFSRAGPGCVVRWLAAGLAGSISLESAVASRASGDWQTYLGDKGRSLYSPLDQINRHNIARLQVAWTYDTGDVGEYQCNNLIVSGILYTSSPTRKVIALDAATGRELWVWNPAVKVGRQRGLVFWQNERGGEQRLFAAAGNRLYALDARNGSLIQDFGEKGSIHLGVGLGVEPAPSIGLNTPGVVHGDRLIIGGFGGPGAVRALDVRTGRVAWTFHLIPRPGEVGHETWPPEAYLTARGTMPWCGQTLDEARGIVYVATKTADPEFYGGDRPGMNLFANSLIALDAATGRRLWHHQLVHHDLLDRDLPCAPVLLTVNHEGKRREVVVQGTKHGLLFVFDRTTGEPLWPIEERPVPQSELPGEQSWPTQPFPTKPAPLMRQRYDETDISTISESARALTLERIQRSPNAGPFPAPSLREAILFPGVDGGMEWGGGAADPDGIYYVNLNEIPWILQMIPTRRPDGAPLAHGERDYLGHCASCHGQDLTGSAAGGMPSLRGLAARRSREEVKQIIRKGGARMPASYWLRDGQCEAILDYLLGTPPGVTNRPGSAAALPTTVPPYVSTGVRRWLDVEGYPAIKPPWGTLNAVDLNTGELKWKVPLGEYPELTARGLPPTGTENFGGPVVTAGGLVFIAATADETMRAFDKDTGRILWQAALPFSGNATPSTYRAGGRQFVVISAGGGKSGRPAGGKLVAFALPSAQVFGAD